MPIYEFICETCDYKFTALCKIGEKVSCPKCGGEPKRLFSTFTISLNNSSEKGSQSSSSCATCSLPSCDSCKL